MTKPKPRKMHQRHGNGVHQQHHAEEFQRGEDGARQGQRAAHRVGGIVRPLHHLGDVVEEEAGEKRRHRRDEKAEPDEEADSAKYLESGLQPVPREANPRGQQPVEQRPQRDEQADGQRQRLEQHAAEGRRQNIAECERGSVEHRTYRHTHRHARAWSGHPFRNGPGWRNGHGMECRVKPGNDDNCWAPH